MARKKAPRKATRMTMKEFYRLLGTINGWYLDDDGGIMIKMLVGKQKKCFCPITAACFLKTGKFFSVKSWDNARLVLHLPFFRGGDIAGAADNTNKDQFLGPFLFSVPTGIKTIRTRLLRATGLKEAA